MHPPPPQLDVLAVIYAPLHRYPSSWFQVELLAERGLRVGVVDYLRPVRPGWSAAGELPTSVDRLPLVSAGRGKRLLEVIDYLRFRRKVARVLSRSRPRVVIAYDTFGFYLTGKTWTRPQPPRLLWHFHELPSFLWRTPARGMVGRAEAFIASHGERPDALMFPDRNRADYMRVRCSLANETWIVRNCPRRRPPPTPGLSADRRTEAGLPRDARIVYFHGALSESRGLLEAIQSMPDWPTDAVLLLVGPVEDGFLSRLMTVAEEAGVRSRVHYRAPVSSSEVMRLAAGADVGLSLIREPENPTWRYSAGAVNKRFEYMAVGLPQVSDNGPGVRELVEGGEVGLCVDPGSPSAIGAAISRILVNPELNMKMRKCARRAHESGLNYEAEFAATGERIAQWCRDANT